MQSIATVHDNTTVNTLVFAQLMQNLSTSVESVASAITDNFTNLNYQDAIIGAYGDFPQGLFDYTYHNLVHSKLAAAASLGLSALWSLAGTSPDLLPVGTNDWRQHLVYMPVYHRVIQPYASARTILSFALSIMIAAVVLCAIGIYSTYLSPINIKSSYENALLDTIDVHSVDARHLQVPGASNNEVQQCKLAFDPARMLYCRVSQKSARCTVCIGHNPNLPLISKADDYD